MTLAPSWPASSCARSTEVFGQGNRSQVDGPRWPLDTSQATLCKLYQPRDRRHCLGELIQIDASDHAWFEDRAPACMLLVHIDDSTSRLSYCRRFAQLLVPLEAKLYRCARAAPRNAALRSCQRAQCPGDARNSGGVQNSAHLGSLPPSQIVRLLSDEGRYFGSESSSDRMLRDAGQACRCGRAIFHPW